MTVPGTAFGAMAKKYMHFLSRLNLPSFSTQYAVMNASAVPITAVNSATFTDCNTAPLPVPAATVEKS